MGSKGYKHTEEAKRKISEARKRRKEELGYLNSPEARKKMSEAKAGIEQSPETIEKRAAALRGRMPVNHANALAKAHAALPKYRAENPNWKGDAAGYSAIHTWIRHNLGTPCKCEACGTETAKRYEWANISGEYERDPSDWQRLCTSCHRKQGYERGEYVTWNKGRKIQTNTGRTHFKKGHVPANKKIKET